MGLDFQANWKAAKELLKKNDVEIPKMAVTDRIKLYTMHRKSIGELFDQLDTAVGKPDPPQARKLFDQLKGKVQAFVKAGVDLKDELQKKNEKNKADVLNTALDRVSGLVEVARAVVTELEDKKKQTEMTEQKIKDWEAKLAEMNRLYSNNVMKKVQNMPLALPDLAVKFKNLREKKVEPAMKQKFNRSTFVPMEEEFLQLMKQLTDFENFLKEAMEQSKIYLEPLRTYMKRPGMEKLVHTEAFKNAKDNCDSSNDHFQKSAKLLLEAKQAANLTKSKMTEYEKNN
ncbi:hypothetical protein [Limnoglobus roseus]|uniref:Uncharacterized protein n=1 Tax=Limnoglobus roseus TaxID=2598579 RepID=A0A5C1A8S4_9BACT|nr:hypothetical protein [Limnoglobus roseus]QEL14416.1 hypothetical protein PX52LOC_01304 [Limnoglobus roseus]